MRDIEVLAHGVARIDERSVLLGDMLLVRGPELELLLLREELLDRARLVSIVSLVDQFVDPLLLDGVLQPVLERHGRRVLQDDHSDLLLEERLELRLPLLLLLARPLPVLLLLHPSLLLQHLCSQLLVLEGLVARGEYRLVEIFDLGHHLRHPLVHRQLIYRGSSLGALPLVVLFDEQCLLRVHRVRPDTRRSCVLDRVRRRQQPLHALRVRVRRRRRDGVAHRLHRRLVVEMLGVFAPARHKLIRRGLVDGHA
mmetsp:Transcript_25521/g.52820  ORF Transcript_25521/g.52820 Transcript_25521/m.52820 type:complete len:254 (-) Transcript_25521:401-1162(-)